MCCQVIGALLCTVRHGRCLEVIFCNRTKCSAYVRESSHWGHGPDHPYQMNIYPRVTKLKVPYQDVITWQEISPLLIYMDINYLTLESLKFKISMCFCKRLHASVLAKFGVPCVSDRYFLLWNMQLVLTIVLVKWSNSKGCYCNHACLKREEK